MQDLIRNFDREGPGRWVCRQSCSVQVAAGRIHVACGTRVMRGLRFENYDIAAALDEEYERQQRKPR